MQTFAGGNTLFSTDNFLMTAPPDLPERMRPRSAPFKTCQCRHQEPPSVFRLLFGAPPQGFGGRGQTTYGVRQPNLTSDMFDISNHVLY